MNGRGRIHFCPSCGARYEIADAFVADPVVVLLCGMCGEGSRLGDTGTPNAPSQLEEHRENTLREAQLPRVVVGHGVPSAARTIAEVLRAADFSPICVRDGVQVLAACDSTMPSRPVAVVLDVGMAGVLVFEVIAQLRAHPETQALPIVLLASVFEPTRYKRRPNSLFGANAYLELHHVPDRLPSLLRELCEYQVPTAAGAQTPNERARVAGLRVQIDASDRDAAHALARRLLSDVALYHGDEISEGLRQGLPFVALEEPLRIAREFFVGAGSKPEVFDAELSLFSEQLMQRHADREQGSHG